LHLPVCDSSQKRATGGLFGEHFRFL
ncbi:hypothetical protein ScFU93_18970, partial [Streptococcus canis]